MNVKNAHRAVVETSEAQRQFIRVGKFIVGAFALPMLRRLRLSGQRVDGRSLISQPTK